VANKTKIKQRRQEYSSSFRDKKAEKGLVQTCVWVPQEDLANFRALAKRLTDKRLARL